MQLPSQEPLWIILSVQSVSQSVLYYDRRSVGQSFLVSSSDLGLMTRFVLLSHNCGFVDMGRPLWREDGSVFYNVQYTIYFTVSLFQLVELSYITTDVQSASLSWYQAPIWGLWPDFSYCQTIVIAKQYFDYCLRIRCRSNVFTEPLHSNKRLLWLHYPAFRRHVTMILDLFIYNFW
jgi:hypothetical protein